jgi:ferric-dicitrate binding protein FerR (iron transport regulator)
MRSKNRVKTVAFEIKSGDNNFEVRATPFTIATGETRFRVSVNESPVIIFAWDEGLRRFAKYEDNVTMAGGAEMAIANTLQKNLQLLQAAA